MVADRIPRMPRVLIADDGRRAFGPPAGLDAGILLRDTDLGAVVERATSRARPLAVDLDTIRGLGADDAALDFVRHRLGIGIVLTRRPSLAARVAESGGLALLQVLAFDSTGLARSLESHPQCDGVGTVVSPGLVLAHMRPAERARLPRPVLAYGLIGTVEDALIGLELADGIVLAAGVAAALAAAGQRSKRDGVGATTRVELGLRTGS